MPIEWCPRGTIKGIPCLHQHILDKNPEEGGLRHTKAEQDTEKRSEEGERTGEGGEYACDNTGSVDRRKENVEQRLAEGTERKQNADEVDEFQFQESAARHVPGGT
ncbi:hypothetical protein NDU88_005133 [Pleurodeles waltl]|uniref:Uncharacterized protein n=1 Tax=Pleurodeles waltl TaxID=8319 RepID=A0AAV7SKT9_PLEWA|nr:hypothetical protein NDU88_005133 [Pleurodeles waltl]